MAILTIEQRIFVLEEAKILIEKRQEYCLCSAMIHTLKLHFPEKFYNSSIVGMEPLFLRENALQFGAKKGKAYEFWWYIGVNAGRIQFLNWMINSHKKTILLNGVINN